MECVNNLTLQILPEPLQEFPAHKSSVKKRMEELERAEPVLVTEYSRVMDDFAKTSLSMRKGTGESEGGVKKASTHLTGHSFSNAMIMAESAITTSSEIKNLSKANSAVDSPDGEEATVIKKTSAFTTVSTGTNAAVSGHGEEEIVPARIYGLSDVTDTVGNRNLSARPDMLPSAENFAVTLGKQRQALASSDVTIGVTHVAAEGEYKLKTKAHGEAAEMPVAQPLTRQSVIPYSAQSSMHSGVIDRALMSSEVINARSDVAAPLSEGETRIVWPFRRWQPSGEHGVKISLMQQDTASRHIVMTPSTAKLGDMLNEARMMPGAPDFALREDDQSGQRGRNAWKFIVDEDDA